MKSIKLENVKRIGSVIEVYLIDDDGRKQCVRLDGKTTVKSYKSVEDTLMWILIDELTHRYLDLKDQSLTEEQIKEEILDIIDYTTTDYYKERSSDNFDDDESNEFE